MMLTLKKMNKIGAIIIHSKMIVMMMKRTEKNVVVEFIIA